MDFNEIKTYIETNKDTNEDVKTYLQGFKQFGVEDVNKFVSENQDGKKWFDSERDKHFDKGLTTWKTNNLNKEIDTEIKKRFPDKDQKDIELENIKAQMESMRTEKEREKLLNVAIKSATDKKIPLSVVDFLLGQDEQSTISNLGKFEESMQSYIQAQVDKRIADGSYTPPKDKTNGGAITLESIKTMSPDEINKNWDAVQKVLSGK